MRKTAFLFGSECYDVYFLDVAKRKRPFFEFFRFDAQLTGDQLMVGHRVELVDPNIRSIQVTGRANIYLCDCGKIQTMFHISKHLPLARFGGVCIGTAAS